MEPKGQEGKEARGGVSRRGAARLEGALLCSDSWGDGAVGANLITHGGGGKTYHREGRGCPAEKTHFPTQIPTILSSLSRSSSPVDLFLMIPGTKDCKIASRSMQVRTMDSTLGAAALPSWLPRMRQATSQGVTLQGHKILHKKLPPSPPNQQAHLANK